MELVASNFVIPRFKTRHAEDSESGPERGLEIKLIGC
jgi:hypothetical protein